jgi:hypothetical protein
MPTCHTGVDDATEGKLEHDIARSEAWLSLFHDVYTAQTELC